MIKLKYISIFCAGAILVSSCKKVNKDYNVDPNNPQDATAELLMNGAMVSTIIVNEGTVARLGGMFTNTFTGVDRQYIGYNQYNATAADFDDVWGNIYTGVIANAKQAEDKAVVSGNLKLAGICEVLQANAYGMAASLFGDVPFTEAAQPDKFTTPKFDSQSSVYAGVQALLDKAIVNLSSSKPLGATAESKDFYFPPSLYPDNKWRPDPWIAVAHSLKARYYMHTRNYAMAKAEAALGISSSAKDWLSPHGTASGADINVYYDFSNNQRFGYMDASDSYAYSLLLGSRNNTKTNDSIRWAYFFLDGANTDSGTDDLNFFGSFFGESSSFPIISYVETRLIAIEAEAKLGSTQASIDALNGLRNFYVTSDYYGAGAKYDSLLLSDFNAGALYNPGTLTPNAALVKEIATERYLALIGQIEQFNDVRRNKNLIGIVPRFGKPKLPSRMLYPQAEINSNPNTPRGGDLFTDSPVWSSAY
jgi:starch-binding outer membrane protein, SusD/RagB family